MLSVMQRREANGSPPDVAAGTITRALTAARPRDVYLTGKNSRQLAILSKLPTPILDATRRRIFRLPACIGVSSGLQDLGVILDQAPAAQSRSGHPRHLVA